MIVEDPTGNALPVEVIRDVARTKRRSCEIGKASGARDNFDVLQNVSIVVGVRSVFSEGGRA